ATRTLSPFLMPSSSSESSVMTDSIMAPPAIFTLTWHMTVPRLTSVTSPSRRLRAPIFMALSLDKRRLGGRLCGPATCKAVPFRAESWSCRTGFRSCHFPDRSGILSNVQPTPRAAFWRSRRLRFVRRLLYFFVKGVHPVSGRLWIAIVVLAASGGEPRAQEKAPDSPYYPLRPGGQWTYRSGEQAVVLRITKPEKAGDALWAAPGATRAVALPS